MKKTIILILVISLFYLIPSIIIKAVYGPSYWFMEGEDCWVPDSNGGWVQHGSPSEGPPDRPSQNIPLLISYLPIFIPALLLFLFIFTPLSKVIEAPKEQFPDENDIEEEDREPL